ncbi:hypothetical protein FIBSPDRAFT_1052183 [Athelia psychrophila]|uniref:Uncharacterized protein n=1 Tax=Athelia psychrophila TaxID=1759441 RepID=A0A165XPI4_9AGAM|nr:hypothetical protein FIBSPDRAFT_1052183 [Fibularhizoctonia sp. CBS 109695]
MSPIMISASSIDVRILGDLPQPSKSRELAHFFVLKIDGVEVLESVTVPGEPLEWKEQNQIQFAPASKIEIAIHRKSNKSKLRKPAPVAEYSGRGMDFLDTSAEQELVAKSGTSRLVVKFNLVAESHTDFMKAVDDTMSQLAKVKRADGAQTATTIGANICTVLDAIVPVLNNFASTHPVLNGAWMVLSSAYKIAQNQIAQDEVARDLLESLREMAGAASSCPDLKKIDGTTNVMEEIGTASLEAARLLHDYVDPSIHSAGTCAGGHTGQIWSIINMHTNTVPLRP